MQRTSADSARSRPRPTWWFDPRFAIGVGLVAVSILAMVFIVSSSDSSVPVYSARTALSPGDRIRSGDLVIDHVRLGEAAARYVVPRSLPRAGLIVTKAVAAGELIPNSAVGAAAGLHVTSLVLPVSGRLSRSVDEGAVVDLWSAAKTATDTFAPPTVLVSAATVVRLVKSEGIVASGDSSAVEVLVPRSATARVLQAITDGDAVSLVPTTVPAG